MFEGTATINGSSFLSNTATSLGGAINLWYSTLTISGSLFDGNTCSTGGAIRAYECHEVTIVDSVFNANSAPYIPNTPTSSVGKGGAIEVEYTPITISNCEFSNNSASGNWARGGAIYARSATVTINDSLFDSNSATTAGGALYIQGSQVMASGVSYDGNSAPAGNDYYCEDGGSYIETTPGALSMSFALWSEDEDDWDAVDERADLDVFFAETFLDDEYDIEALL